MLAEALWKKPEEFSGAWNFGPDQNSVKTVQEMVERAASEWDIKADWEASQDNHPHEASLLQLNSKKAKSMIGWKPHMNFEKAVSETINCRDCVAFYTSLNASCCFVFRDN